MSADTIIPSVPTPARDCSSKWRKPVRILILSWRCPRHPKAGGAEAFTHEVAKRLVTQGNSVEWFTSSFDGAPEAEDLDGIRIVRAGSWLTVYWHAINRYRKTGQSRFDIVIDEVNVLPFFAHAWSKTPTFALIFQLHRAVWFYQTAAPIAALGFLAEPLYMRACRRTPTLTISDSTRRDLLALGYAAPIKILPVGVDPIATPSALRVIPPRFIYVGRIVPAKRVDHIIRAFARHRSEYPSAALWLVGTGPESYRRSLNKLVARLGIRESVHFFGHLPRAEKHRRMGEATALLMTSVREGWGLVVAEANACGTPAIVYDVPGLRDAVRDETTGLVVYPRPKFLAAAMTRLAGDGALHQRLASEALKWSATFSWDETTRVVHQALDEVLRV